MFSDFIDRFRIISLKWKLLIPYLFFSFVGTTSLVLIGLSSQQEIIKEEEKKELLRYYEIFQASVRMKAEQALAMATVIAEDPIIEDLLRKRNRSGLLDYTQPLFEKLKKDFGVRQLHFHVLPGKSFLRVHQPDQSGEMIAYRTSIMDVLKTGRGTKSLEWGLTGLGIRGVAPVIRDKELAGSLEIGYPFGRSFLEKLTERWGPDFSVYEKKGPHTYTLLASTKTSQKRFSPSESLVSGSFEKSQIFIAPPRFPHIALLAGPLRDYRGDVVALVEIEVNRSAIIHRLSQTKTLMVVVALVGICVSFFLVWIVAILFIRPIKEIVAAAQEIAQGKRETRLKPRSNDEIGVLGRSLNTMLNSLKERRLQIEEYARTLERRVQERTTDLVSSEEKYRTLVDNLPVGVYRILSDGTIEFINPYLIDTLGFDPEDMLGNRFFWQEKVWGYDETQSKGIMDILKNDPLGFRRERVVMDKQGQRHVFMDQAIPFWDDAGNLRWFEGIMVDITELKNLQEKALRTEEIRLLGEISARFAHEMRNPLATVGGFARRLKDALSENERQQMLAKIIMDEVARLEDILKSILSSIKPFTLNLVTVNLNEIIQSSLNEEEGRVTEKRIRLVTALSPSNPSIQGDEVLLKQALDCILKNEIINMPEGEKLFLSTDSETANVMITIRHNAKGLANEDLSQFFYPRFTGNAETTIHDLPLARIVIHRHSGKVDVVREGEDVVLKIELPLKQPV
ncbi:MAG: HAMP domain-containing protein [Deltaproteobacteria bacterium]|nr:HAMP domain-containing protein [Deltaproteobacteria bacterium]